MSRGKTPIPLDLPRPAALGDGGQSKQAAVYDALRQAILRRHLPAGVQLPSSRSLSQRWLVSRGIIEAVYERLCAEGYLSRSQGSGTYVHAVIPDTYIAATSSSLLSPQAQDPERAHLHPVSNDASITESRVRAGSPFLARLPDPALFPLTAWSRHLARSVASAGESVLKSADPLGLYALREQIADYLKKYRNIECEPGDVIITTGTRHAIDFISRALLRAGDKVCVEDPGYPSAANIFRLSQAELEFIPVDAEGIDLQSLQPHGDAKLVYVTPAHQSPLGVTMSVTRRLALLEWARMNNVWVVEDDYDSEFNYNGAPLPALMSVDRYNNVLYCGSFNKTLYSELRVGFIVARFEMRDRLAKLWQIVGRSAAITEQIALSSYMGNGAFARHLRLARQTYAKRRDILLDTLQEHAAGTYKVSGHQAGFHFVLWLENQSHDSLGARAAQSGLMLQFLSEFCRKIRLPPAIIVGFTALSDAQTAGYARVLARVLLRETEAAASVPGPFSTDQRTRLSR